MNERHLFHGTAPALVTPFTPDGAIDEPAFRRLIDDQIAGGVDALVVLGTTGENPTVTTEERTRLVHIGIEHTNRRVPVIIGVGSNNTAESIRFAREAKAAGAEGMLVVGPYYNKPTPAGVIAHVSAIADAADTPIILYNVPGRTGSNLTADTQLAVAEKVPTVVGLKEASGNLAQISDILQRRPAHLAVYSGDDELTLPMIALGAEGIISVICNAIPKRFCYMVRAGLAGDYETARRLHFEMLDAMRMCFIESNPVPLKEALAHAGMMSAHVRLPLVGLQPASREKVLRAFAPFMKG